MVAQADVVDNIFGLVIRILHRLISLMCDVVKRFFIGIPLNDFASFPLLHNSPSWLISQTTIRAFSRAKFKARKRPTPPPPPVMSTTCPETSWNGNNVELLIVKSFYVSSLNHTFKQSLMSKNKQAAQAQNLTCVK